MSFEVMNEFLKLVKLDTQTEALLEQIMVDDPALYPAIMYDIGKLVNKFFTVEELSEINTFLSTPIGKKWFDKELNLFKDIELVLAAHTTIHTCQQKLSLLSLPNTSSEIN
jgi:hypothetical protein